MVGGDPWKHVSSKVDGCRLIARAQGYKWAWIDTCCIDKTSSAELSEAINSMFRWYSLSTVCYVFLHDVHADDHPEHKHSMFRRSMWHTRGWTLQELLAPRLVIFLSSEWSIIGDKGTFAPILEEMTGIPIAVLRGEQTLQTSA